MHIVPIRCQCTHTGLAGAVLSVSEPVLRFNGEVETAFPCIDWAHEHARNNGSLNTKKDYKAVLDRLAKGLGKRAMKKMHSHYSQIEYTPKGEKKHMVFNSEDRSALPDHKLVIRAMNDAGIVPFVISECRDSQDAGAIELFMYYESLQK